MKKKNKKIKNDDLKDVTGGANNNTPSGIIKKDNGPLQKAPSSDNNKPKAIIICNNE